MPDGKIRHANHIIDQQACRFLQGVFPIEWVQRPISPDYGIDLDLELFGYEDGECVTLGEHVFLQVKGTETAEYGSICLFGKGLHTEKELADVRISVLKFSIEVPLLRLVERMGSAMPVLLTVVDLKIQKAYYVCLNDYIRYVLVYQNPNFRNQGHVTIYIPTENVLSEGNTSVGLWYGKRAKLYGLFQEIQTLADDIQNVDVYEKLEIVEQRIAQIAASDAWQAGAQWPLMDWLHRVLDDMTRNFYINQAGESMLALQVPHGADPFEIMVLYEGSGDTVSAITAARAVSCDWFLDQAKAVSSAYENNMRHIGLPTKKNWMLNR